MKDHRGRTITFGNNESSLLSFERDQSLLEHDPVSLNEYRLPFAGSAIC